MTAIRVVSPSGSDGSLQFKDSNEFAGDAKLTFKDTTLFVTGTSVMSGTIKSMGPSGGALSGSITRTKDDKSYLVAGSGVTITSASNGQVTVAMDPFDSDLGNTLDQAYDEGATGAGAIITVDNQPVQIKVAGASSVALAVTGTAIFGSSSVATSNHLPPLPGTNVTFFVSGTKGAGVTPPSSGVALFSGDVVLSGTLFGGSPLKVGNDFEFNTTDGTTPSLKNPSGSIKLFARDEVKLGSDAGTIRLIDLGSSAAGNIYVTGSATSTARKVRIATKGELHLTGGVSLRVKASESIFSGGASISGTLAAKGPFGGVISGSINNTKDGVSYLVAGSNVTITSASNGQVTIASSGGGGSISVSSGSTTISSISRIDLTDGFVVNDSQSGISSITSSIGKPEDGLYTDGLFTDFLPTTPIGTAIDRFNEVLKALAPAPAPDLDNINSLHSGSGVYLSFGSSNNLSSATPAYTSVAGSAGIGSAVDVNSLYTIVTSSNNIRMGVFDGDTHVTGVLNSDVAYNSQGNSIQNYPAFSFGDGGAGVVRLTVNGSTIKTVDLSTDPIGSGTSGLGSGSHIDANGSGFKFFSAASTGTLSNGNAFDSFKHRTGKYFIGSGSQRRGWNYARVQHIKTGSTTTTNYIEWVNDDDPNTLVVQGTDLSFDGSGSIHLSGIEYFRSGTGTYKVRVRNAYKNVYDTNNITFTTSNSAASKSGVSYSISAQSKPTINTGDSETHAKILHLTGSSSVTADYFLSGSITAGVSVTHPLKTNLSNAGQATTTGIWMYNLSNSSTALVETFRREDYRIVSGAYNTQASLYSGANQWDSKKHMTASNGGHSNGLLFYRTRLYSITAPNSGDFRDDSEGGTLNNVPLENPNYSGETGQRTFYRWFKNETGSTKYDLSIAINGSGSTIVSAATALNSSRIRVFVKFPSNGSRETGWLDLASEFVLDSYDDNDGAHTANGSLSFDSSLNATNYVTLGTVGIGNNEYIGLRIEADEAWTGYVSDITVSFGGGTGSTAAIPDLDDIDCNDDGTDCKLSFGSSKSITGYTNVGTTAGFSATDINGSYATAASSNNLRRSVFGLDTIIEGDLNEDVSADSNGSHTNHVANSFSDANSGSLKLEVNGSVVHTVEITGSYNLVGSGAPGSGGGTTVNGNGSGFFSLSTWEAAEYNNGVPDYTEIYRTGKWRVVVSDQRNGWNYARVVHSVAGSDRTTNYVEWVNDNDSSTLSADNVSVSNFSGSNNLFHLSGIRYYTHCTASLYARFVNSYRDVYSSDAAAISVVNTTNVSVQNVIASGTLLTDKKVAASSTTMPVLSTTAGSELTNLNLTASLVFSSADSLPENAASAGGALKVKHPLKSNVTTATQTKSNFMVFSSSDNSNLYTEEYFSGEKYRIISGSYTTQGQVSAGTGSWDSTKSVNNVGNTNYYSGLIIYDGHLVTPLTGGNSGDYRSVADGGSLQGPNGNVNYSSPTVGRREYFRGFENNTVNDVAQVTITIRGNATIKALAGPNSGSLGSNDSIHVECKVPGKTGWLDMARASAGAGNISDGDGALSGDLTDAVISSGAENICTFNGQTVNGTGSSEEYIAIRITAHKNWTGYLDRITVAYA